MAIITISRQLGSLGRTIAKLLVEELGYNFLDEESLEAMIGKHEEMNGVSMQKYDEKKPALWDAFSSDKYKYLNFIKSTVYEFAQQGNCVILGRGGQCLLKDLPGLLHVRIIAPLETKVERIKQQFNCDNHYAKQIVQHSEHDRAGFHKFFFHIDWEDPKLYDLVINTSLLTVKTATDLIKQALLSKEIHEREHETSNKLTDLSLGQEVITTILYTEKIPVRFLEVMAEDRIVTLKGSVDAIDDIERSEWVARQVPGVRKVVNRIYSVPNIYYK
jgi:cytidylate kinase